MQFELLAVDPGVHVGLAATRVSSDDDFKIHPENVRTNTVRFPKDFSKLPLMMMCRDAVDNVLLWWLNKSGEHLPHIVGFELWRMQPGNAYSSNPQGFSAMWVHALILDRLAVIPGLKVLNYTAGTSKGQCTDDRLKEADLWIVGQRHERDACRVLWCMQKRMAN